VIGDILQPTHLLFILVIALLVLGPKRLPEVGRALGRGLRDFRNALNTDDLRDQMISTTSTETMTPTYEEPTAQTETTFHSEPTAQTEIPFHSEPAAQTEIPFHSEPAAQTETPLGHESAQAEPSLNSEPVGAAVPTEVTSEPAAPTAPHEPANPAPTTDPVS
jgi:sec-independent protein translocase protein TatA